jgi:hypothetical protein
MIYTTSCRDKDYADLKPLLQKLDAQLIDVRFSPSDKPVQWSKGYLQLLLKRNYQHFPALGLREIAPGKFAIQNLTLGLRILSEKQHNVVLLCDCADYDNCHRKVIARELEKSGKEAVEIETWEASTLTLFIIFHI